MGSAELVSSIDAVVAVGRRPFMRIEGREQAIVGQIFIISKGIRVIYFIYKSGELTSIKPLGANSRVRAVTQSLCI